MTDFKTIPLSEIHPDKNQPRKYYDVSAMEELTASVKEKGILQPILIRPNGKGYILVCGERRFKAATTAGLKDIPAVIRVLSDEEALELQIIENLQRKDVHPMEEAVAFKSLLERKANPITMEELANRIGKKPMFIRQRVKLNALIKPWQQVFYKNLLSVTDALAIAALHLDQQNSLAQEYNLDDKEEEERKIEIDSWRFKKYLGNLRSATFDITDPTLSPKFGPCTTCPFNSAVASLFPEDAENPVCTNIPDYVLKTNVSFERKLKESQADPATVLVSTSYYGNRDECKKYEKDGQSVFTASQYLTLDKPEKPDWAEFKENNEDEEWSDSKMQVEYEKEVAQYNKDMADFEKQIAGGKYIKALVVNDCREKGSFIYVKINASKTSLKTDSSNPEKLTALDVDLEIKRIKEKEERSRELDLEKVNKNMVIAIAAHKAFKQPGFKYQKIDRTLMIHLLLEGAGYTAKDKLNKLFGLKQAQYSCKKGYQFDYFKQYEKITDDQLAFIIRAILKEKYAVESNTGPTAGITALRIVSEYLGDIDLKAIEKEQSDIRDRRNERIAGRIKSLNKTKAELKAPKVSTEKKPAKKATTADKQISTKKSKGKGIKALLK